MTPTLSLNGTAHIGATRIFGPLSMMAPAGAWTCLLGPSGVGKSTILRLFAGLDEGITFDGDYGASDGGPLMPRVAMMAQDDLLLPWLDVMGNVTLGARMRGERPDHTRARDILARVGLADHAAKPPSALSGGQRQRAALARTLMEDRPIVLLDEPFSALDAQTRARMQRLAGEVLRERTVLHITHDAAEAARLGDQILLMSRDRIDAIAPPEGTSPRAPDAEETLRFEAQLMRRLMADA
ncbi:putative hydroxymethylpyrimidine transport system ATP-binding protein [Poseidonocella pacifica]|uniref:Putative hydroxymethylpyrimidine transport system ATP-binding protein n=1 Tax=Poseidonocella pacifica TaxID=871651 RepID=A0A1I0YDY7_9RHOB|nr:ABC transporter ATP-binding protein [Poseidonocella pacifica]SFB11392.1 putative hydroxymethylpyrimidine transport system ATP-binding protein [Poseidonocella pacifica]